MNLPADASNDQANCPDGYYRRNTGMLHQIGEQPQSPAAPLSLLSADEVEARIDGMSVDELKTLVRRYMALHGDLMLLSEGETGQAMLDTLAATALRPVANGSALKADIQSRMAAIDKWLDRTKGKPTQYIDQRIQTVSHTSANDMTNAQLMAALRALPSMPAGVKLLEDGKLEVVDVEYAEVKSGES